MTMTAAPHYVTRRATTDDLSQLIPLWQLEQLPAERLEKRFTEFQVVSDDAGKVLAAIGLQISGSQGWLHSESIAQAEIGDSLRELLWKRLQIIIQNHALEQLWTQVNVPFWRELGFEPAAPEQLEARPAPFKENDRPWHVKRLRAADAAAALEREFGRLKMLQQEESQRMKDRAQWLKRTALAVTVVVFMLVVAWAVALLKYGPQLLHRR